MTAHEFFHLWNVKRIRPQSLEPIDYTKENYTRALWFSEGVTSTVENIILFRAGLLDEPGFLRKLGEQITELERRRRTCTQSAEVSSLDAWLEKYPFYRQPARSISYYNKGELLGVMLDLEVREASQGKASLRDVFQWMNKNYAQQGKFFPDSEGVRERGGRRFARGSGDRFLKNMLRDSTKFPGMISSRRSACASSRRTARWPTPDSSLSTISMPRLRCIRVRAGSEAERAGLKTGDDVLDLQRACGGVRLRTTDRRTASGRHDPRCAFAAMASNARVQWKVGSREQVEFDVKDVDNVTTQQKARRAAWLKGEAQLTGD